MSPTFAARTFTIALASLITLAMVSGMNALAGHEYRVAAAAQSDAQPMLVASTQFVTIVGHRQQM
jgi:hypothetical protein